MKNFITLFLCLIFLSMPAFAVKGVKFITVSESDFNPELVVNKYMKFKTTTTVSFDEGLIIPLGSTVTVFVETTTKEKRFHKSGFFTCKLLKYTNENDEISVVSKKMKLIGRRYDKIDGKEAAKTGAELTATTAASFFILPGIDIAYYFTKGAIQNTKAETRFKSGVHNAYDNSIMWIFLKGKPIEFKKGDNVTFFMYEDDGSITDKDMEKFCQ